MKGRVAAELILLVGLALLAYVCLVQQRQLEELEEMAWNQRERLTTMERNGAEPPAATPAKPRTRKPKAAPPKGPPAVAMPPDPGTT